MANPETGKVEVKATMNVTQERWDAIFGKKTNKEEAEDDAKHPNRC